MTEGAADMSVYLSRSKIASRVRQLGHQISNFYMAPGRMSPPHIDQSLIVMPVLKGAATFAADLMRQMTMTMVVEYVHASSYQGKTKSSGQVDIRFLHGMTDLRGRDILIVEDIVHTGRTIQKVVEWLEEEDPYSIRLVSLLWHPGKSAKPAWVGFDVPHPDTFVAGYGMDYDERMRNLPDILKIE